MSFTIKELREMTKLEGCKAVFDPDDFRTIQEQLPSRFTLFSDYRSVDIYSPTKKQVCFTDSDIIKATGP